MKIARLIFLVTSLLFVSVSVSAQNTGNSTSQLYLVTKNDGKSFYGYIVEDDGREILLNTKTIGMIYINKSDIKQIKPVDESEIKVETQGEYKELRDQGPFTTRYYLNTNALPIKKNENYAMLHLYGPEVHFAVTDNLNLGVMATWIASPLALAAKYSFDSESNTHFALGTIMGSSGFLANSKIFGGLHWATVTHGTRMSNFSISGGYGYINFGEFMEYNDPRYTFSYAGGYNYTPYYSAHLDNLETHLYGTPDPTYEQREFGEKGLQGALSFGLSGITPVGKKASLILDVMGFIGPSNQVVYGPEQTFVSTVQRTDLTSENRTFLYRQGQIQDIGNFKTFLIMPGMRFNPKYGTSFQVVLSGLVMQQADGQRMSTPLPMISWFRQF